MEAWQPADTLLPVLGSDENNKQQASPLLRLPRRLFSINKQGIIYLEIMASDEQNRSFFTAVHNGDLETVGRYLDNGVDLETRTSTIDDPSDNAAYAISNHTALMIAVLQGHDAIVSELLTRGADIKARDSPSDEPVLYTAAMEGSLSLVQILLDHGAETTSPPSHDHPTVLHLLARLAPPCSAHRDIADLILRRNLVDTGTVNKIVGRTALDCAAKSGNLDMVKLLVEHRPRTDTVKPSLTLSLAAGSGHKEVVKFLLESGEPSDLGRGLYSAAYFGDVTVVQLLLDHGAEFSHSEEHISPLQIAADRGHTEVLRLLVEKANHSEAGVSDRRTALHHALNSEIAEYLLSKGYDVDARDSFGETPLFHRNGVSQQNPKSFNAGVTRALIRAGANVNARNHSGESALFAPLLEMKTRNHRTFEALENVRKYHSENSSLRWKLQKPALYYSRGDVVWEAFDVVKLLLEEGIDVNVRSNDGRVAAHSILHRFHGPAYNHLPSHTGLEVFRMLRDKGADLSFRDKTGISLLHQAVLAGDCPIIDFLIENGADVNAKMEDGSTPLFLAVAVDPHHGRIPCLPAVRMLLQHGADPKLALPNGRTVLHEVAASKLRWGEVDGGFALLLVEYGADADARNEHGQTALDLALDANNMSITRVLGHTLERDNSET